MKNYRFVLFLVLTFCIHAHAQNLKARIKIDVERKIGDIDKNIYGNFTEHLGRCIYGGIYDPKSSQASTDGFRKDVLDATKNLGVTVVRWPGGNFASGYHWIDGIGPKDQRPKRKDLAWGDIEPNNVGTDEFLKWSITAGVQPYICGADWTSWNRTVLNTLGNYIDYISLHHYSGNRDTNHYKFMAATNFVENVIKITEGQINETRTKNHIQKPIYIAFDEYNVWYRAFNQQKLEEHYNMQDALVVAEYLNCFIRNAQIVKMANMAQLVNVIAPMMITNDKLWFQTTYYPLQLFAQNCTGESIASFVDCDTYNAGDYKNVPYLDISVVYNDSTKELLINVVNRHLDKAIETSIENQFGKLASKATVYEVNAASITDENTVNEQKVKTTEGQIDVKDNTVTYSFAPHSFTMIKVKLNK